MLLAPDVCDHQLPAIRSLDERIGKELRADAYTMNVDSDSFNIVNVGTVFGRSTMWGRPTGRRADGAGTDAGDRESEPPAGRVSA